MRRAKKREITYSLFLESENEQTCWERERENHISHSGRQEQNVVLLFPADSPGERERERERKNTRNGDSGSPVNK